MTNFSTADNDEQFNPFHHETPLYSTSLTQHEPSKTASAAAEPAQDLEAVDTVDTARRSGPLIVTKILLLLPLLFSIYVIPPLTTNSDTDSPSSSAAFISALNLHQPSLRVFRALTELCFLLFCAAFSLWCWEHTFEQTNADNQRRTGGDTNSQSLNDEYEMNAIGELLFASVMDGADTIEEYVDEDYYEEDAGQYEMVERKEESPKVRQNNQDEHAAIDTLAIETSAAPTRVTSKPPFSSTVTNLALDLLIMIMLTLFLFTLGMSSSNKHADVNSDSSEKLPSSPPSERIEKGWGGMMLTVMKSSGFLTAFAPVIPLLLFFGFFLFSVLPWNTPRKSFWKVLSLTTGAPFNPVSFRDGFIGDILTSTVRPLQDLTFTVFYLTCGLQGWWTSAFQLHSAAEAVEKSWLVHTVLLPSCMVSPLWWRFLQNLRQCYETKQRWPYLGNALKYLIAAEVALFGVFNPGNKSTVVWITCFTGATLYQVWWDTFMDWELFVVQWDDGSFALRTRRLYPQKWIYMSIFFLNFLLRFCWTLSFIPQHYMLRSGVFVDAQNFPFDSAVAAAEILRRTLWGLIRVELAAIKLMEERKLEQESIVGSSSHRSTSLEQTDIDEDHDGRARVSMDIERFTPQNNGLLYKFFESDMSDMTDNQILGELCIWATVFTSLGIVAASHRK